MELRFQMNDILPLLPVPQPPMGRSSYNIPCPVCDHAGSRKRHLNINLKRNVFRCPKCGQFEGGVFDLYAYYTGVPRDKVREDLIDRLGGKDSRYTGKAVGPKSACTKPKEIPQAAVARIEIRDRVYRALLSKLTLASDHRENLLGRGLTGEEIDRLEYRTTPVVGFHALEKTLMDEGYDLFGVPGFYRDQDGRWTMAIYLRGIMIPCRDRLGRIQSIHIRLDKKMKKGGVSGLTSLQYLETTLKELTGLGVRHVLTCFDMDYLKNWHVEAAYVNLVNLLGGLPLTFGTYLWSPDYNGLDDFIWEFFMEKRPLE